MIKYGKKYAHIYVGNIKKAYNLLAIDRQDYSCDTGTLYHHPIPINTIIEPETVECNRTNAG
jgi:hypothetical protein